MINKNILLIIEGEIDEKKYFDRLGELFFDKKAKLVFHSFKSNIYSLYHAIKDLEYTETLDVIRQISKPEDIKHFINLKIAEIYLIFDFDPQEPAYKSDILEDMLETFSNETNYGKLYINYPMFESLKDHNNFNLDDYIHRSISPADCSSRVYKELVLERGYKKQISSYTQRHFRKLCKINLIKGNYMIFNEAVLPDYHNYQKNMIRNIATKQMNAVKLKEDIQIINTSVFFLLDYFGEREFVKVSSSK